MPWPLARQLFLFLSIEIANFSARQELKIQIQVTIVKEEEILDLSGGGDWHTAYILLYEASKCPIITAEIEEQMDTV